MQQPDASGPSAEMQAPETLRAFTASGDTLAGLGPRDGWPLPAGNWNRLDKRYAIVDLIGNLIPAALLSLVVLGQLADERFGWESILGAFGSWWRWPALAVAALFVLNALLSFRRVRTMGWVMRRDDFVFRRGLLFQRTTAVPYGRLQIVDISQGPLQRLLGLASLKFVTAAASGTLNLPGLRQADADRLRDELIAIAETRRSGV